MGPAGQFERCMASGKDYPSANEADPFVPIWALRLYAERMRSSALFRERQDLVRAFENHAAVEQLFLLMRYVCMKMGLTMLCSKNASMSVVEFLAETQCSAGSVSEDDFITRNLRSHSQKLHDPHIMLAQQDCDPSAGVWSRQFEAPILQFQELLPKMEQTLREISDLLGAMSPLHKLVASGGQAPGGISEEQIADVITSRTGIAKFDAERLERLPALLERFVEIVETKVTKTPSGVETIIDQTSLL